MRISAFTSFAHFSVVWGVTLAVITLIEWHSLDRDPVRQEIFSPFIERHIAVTVLEAPTSGGFPLEIVDPDADAELRYDVQFHFNGPLFLAAFFTPILIFSGAGMLAERLKKS